MSMPSEKERLRAKPFPQSFWVVEGLLCAGQFPGDEIATKRDEKLNGLLDCGIRRIINLIMPRELGRGKRPFEPYVPRLEELASERGFSVEILEEPIRDQSIPSRERMLRILDLLDDSVAQGIPTYIHCWGGHGRTGTVVCCYFIRQGETADAAIETLLALREDLPTSYHPFEGNQEDYVRTWESDDERRG